MPWVPQGGLSSNTEDRVCRRRIGALGGTRSPSQNSSAEYAPSTNEPRRVREPCRRGG